MSVSRQTAIQMILSLLLEGKCSIEANSVIMKRFAMPCSSVGFISEYLNKAGSSVYDTFKNDRNETQYVVFLSDEIFAKKVPILVTVDPINSAILKIELADTRKADDWIKHWNCIEGNGHMAIYLVSDEGTGLTSGHAQGLSDVVWQPDTFHAIAHRLGIWMKRFDKSAYQAMQEEYDCEATLDSAVSDGVISRRIEKHDELVKATFRNIALYEQFKYLHSRIIKELEVSDTNGNLRERKETEENIKIYLDLMDTFMNITLSNTINKIRKILDNLLKSYNGGNEKCQLLWG
ncbi:MAG: hypothetical protein HQK65_12885 [Desulfamplus sp.]|nr:hypothetical protein [Desulfamplus sp.]